MDLKTITDIFFHQKRNWPDITNEDKETFFFIFNRYMAKKYPLHAQAFNYKDIDKAVAFNVWFAFLKQTMRRPDWFWAGSKKGTAQSSMPSKDLKLVMEEYEISESEALLLNDLYPKELKKDINRINKINEEKLSGTKRK
jgi:hypothetical protein